MSDRLAVELIEGLRARGVVAAGISCDSRTIGSGDVFAAWPGFASDGRKYVEAAIARGATAVLYENGDGFELRAAGVPAIGVTGLRDLAGFVAHALYDKPSESLWMTGVTGTNGKTTVSQWIAAASGLLGERCGVIGTLGSGYPGEVFETVNTTPDVLALHRSLRRFADEGARGVAMEVSSIGLEQGRVNGVAFDAAVFTNLSRDHLDYHGDMDAYAAAKARLFDFPGLRYAVINADDPFGLELVGRARRAGVEVTACMLQDPETGQRLGGETLSARLIPSSAFGMHLLVHWRGMEGDLRARVVGRFNAHNLLAVVGVLLAHGVPFEEALAAASRLEPPLGRMQLFGGVGEPLVVVDYAHSPDALAKLLDTCRETASSRGGALVCVFGCGGDRDPGKRPLMGEVVRQRADRVVVTSDNPRSEDPLAIIEAVRAGAGCDADAIIDRADAIARAIADADADDVVVLAGKGHETYQEVLGRRVPFSDAEHAAAALRLWSSVRGSAA